MAKQIMEFKPRVAAVIDAKKAEQLKAMVSGVTKILGGPNSHIEACVEGEADVLINSTVGISGLKPTLMALENGMDVASANKEPLVAAGELVMQTAKKNKVKLIPIDSEHSAIMQCLAGNEMNKIESIVLTCSGGPFRGKTRAQLKDVTLEDALKHPTWKMGGKITIDSATLMNKGLEVIEAKWLFGLAPDQIRVVIHPQSVIHSMVCFEDGSVMAQLGRPDMRIPIQYALNYPARPKNNFERLNLKGLSLTLDEPDMETFKPLKLAYAAMIKGGTMPAAMNGANEKAVELFLQKKVRFLQIGDLIEEAMASHKPMPVTVDNVMAADAWSRTEVERLVLKG
jgi:1-deoxy-D-xylulose-5-phosphate reductoisomerase